MIRSRDRSLIPLFRAAVVAASLAAMLATAGRAAAQLTPINFPDTPVGQTSTVKCPTNSVGICFGQNCSATGTIQGITGPDRPFKITKLNLLTVSQFNTGTCEASPTALPVTVGPGKILAFQGTFTPTSVGTFSGSATFSTPAGPATVNLSGKGVSSNPGRTDKGLIALQLSSNTVVPGSALGIQYRTARKTLQGNADLYFVAGFPSGQILFVNDQGGVTPSIQPFRRNVNVTDTTQTVFSGPVPIDAAFGNYTFYMAMVYAGMTPDPNNLTPSLASPIAQASLTYSALSPDQRSIIAARGNPDFISVLSVGSPPVKREAWLFQSGTPTQILWVNGVKQSQDTVSGGPGGPKLDPSLFTPQMTLGQLTAALGPPTSVTPSPIAPGYQTVVYRALGLTVILKDGQLGSAVTVGQ